MSKPYPPLLKKAMLGNAAFSAATGTTMLLLPGSLAGWLGVPDPAGLRFTGVVLLLFAGHLVLAARRTQPVKAEILYFCLADAAWVLGSLAILWLQPFALTAAGFWVILVVALFVADFMGLQWWGLQKAA